MSTQYTNREWRQPVNDKTRERPKKQNGEALKPRSIRLCTELIEAIREICEQTNRKAFTNPDCILFKQVLYSALSEIAPFVRSNEWIASAIENPTHYPPV